MNHDSNGLKSEMIQILLLRAEYETLKGKVRKYRAERTTNSGASDNTTANSNISTNSSRAG